jgi:hypothetical protein
MAADLGRGQDDEGATFSFNFAGLEKPGVK